MPVEMSRLPIPESGGAVWLLFPDDEGFWRWMGRREPEVFAGWLMGKGCLQTDTASFRRVRVSKFECGQNRN
jgi:hypothetical protein